MVKYVLHLLLEKKVGKGYCVMINRKLLFGLNDGDIIPNYKELCNILKLPVLSGNSKIAQEEELKRYMDFEKIGHKYHINKIYQNPLPDLSAKGSLYYELLELVLCEILSDHISVNGTLYRSTINQLAESVGFVNDIYFQYLWHKNKLSAQLDVPLETVERLYKESQRNYKSVIYRTLTNMEKHKIIKFQEVYYVQEVLEKDNVIIIDKADKYGDKTSTIYRPIEIDDDFRKATEKEIQVITETEYEILKRYEADNIYELYKLGIAGEYYNIVQQKLIDKLGIGRYYKVLEIYLIKDGLQKRAKKLSENIKELNSRFYDKLIKNKDNDYQLIADTVIKLPCSKNLT